MTATGRVDFGKTAADYGRYRVGFPRALFERLGQFGVGLPGQRVLDLGTGTGALARSLASGGCQVTALDLAEPLLEEARRLDGPADVSVRYVLGRAEALPFATSRFDVVTAGQCWHWFDGAKTAREVRRLLVPGGWFVAAHYDWLPLPGNVVAATEELILRHNPAWRRWAGRNGFHAECVHDAAVAGFVGIETFTFDEPAGYTHHAWRGRVRASSGVSASLDRDQVTAFDADLARLLSDTFPDEPLVVAHRVFAMVCRTTS